MTPADKLFIHLLNDADWKAAFLKDEVAPTSLAEGLSSNNIYVKTLATLVHDIASTEATARHDLLPSEARRTGESALTAQQERALYNKLISAFNLTSTKR